MLETFEDAHRLFRHAQENEPFRRYLSRRTALLAPVAAAMVLTGIALAAGTVVFLGGTSSLLVLPAILLVPVVLAGSVFIQLYLFGTWLELRAIAEALGHATGRFPVPWALVVGLFLVPFAMLAAVSWLAAVGVVALTASAPLLYAHLDVKPQARSAR